MGNNDKADNGLGMSRSSVAFPRQEAHIEIQIAIRRGGEIDDAGKKEGARHSRRKPKLLMATALLFVWEKFAIPAKHLLSRTVEAVSKQAAWNFPSPSYLPQFFAFWPNKVKLPLTLAPFFLTLLMTRPISIS